MIYQQAVTTQEEAISHLFFHCCFNDNEFNDAELKAISDKLVTAGLHTNLNFKEEVIKYRSYRMELQDEEEYLQYLVSLIRPTNELALFSYCVELCLGDGFLGASEENLLRLLAKTMDIEEAQHDVITKLLIQRKVVETQKLF
ncbi:MAG: hypothetical protein ACO1NX_05200 [Chitinophagaceae bacterium]